MNKRKRFAIWLFITALLAIAAAFYFYPTLACPDGEYDLTGTEWILTSLNGKTPVKEAYSGTLSLAFNQKRADGYGGCALLLLDYTLTGSKIDLSNPDFRYVACPEPINSQENEYLRTLQRVTCVQQSGNQLILTGPLAELVYSPFDH